MLNYVTTRKFLCYQALFCSKNLRLLYSACSHSALNSQVPDQSDASVKSEISKVNRLLTGKIRPKSIPVVDPDYQMIYRYPAIETIRSISRMKFYSLLSNSLMISSSLAFEYFEYLPPYSTLILAALGTGLTIAFCVVGILLNRFIGLIYYNGKTDVVRLASLSYTGIRVDDYVPRTQLTPFKTLKYFPMLSAFTDEIGKKEYKIISQNGVINPIVYSYIFNADPTAPGSNLGLQTGSPPPPTEKDVNFEDLIRRVRSENEKAKKEK